MGLVPAASGACSPPCLSTTGSGARVPATQPEAPCCGCLAQVAAASVASLQKCKRLMSVYPLLPPNMRREEWSLHQFEVGASALPPGCTPPQPSQPLLCAPHRTKRPPPQPNPPWPSLPPTLVQCAECLHIGYAHPPPSPPALTLPASCPPLPPPLPRSSPSACTTATPPRCTQPPTACPMRRWQSRCVSDYWLGPGQPSVPPVHPLHNSCCLPCMLHSHRRQVPRLAARRPPARRV